MTLKDRIETEATLENAKEWWATQEKYTFCLDLVELSFRADGETLCDRAVNMLEDKFRALLLKK